MFRQFFGVLLLSDQQFCVFSDVDRYVVGGRVRIQRVEEEKFWWFIGGFFRFQGVAEGGFGFLFKQVRERLVRGGRLVAWASAIDSSIYFVRAGTSWLQQAIGFWYVFGKQILYCRGGQCFGVCGRRGARVVQRGRFTNQIGGFFVVGFIFAVEEIEFQRGQRRGGGRFGGEI